MCAVDTPRIRQYACAREGGPAASGCSGKPRLVLDTGAALGKAGPVFDTGAALGKAGSVSGTGVVVEVAKPNSLLGLLQCV